MGSLAQSVENRKALLSHWQSIYDSHRFLDAFQATSEYWTPSTSVDQLSAEEMVFAGRLASRLGGMRLSRHLYRKARKRDPASPTVRYFSRHISGPKDLLLDELLEFEKNPDLGGDDPDLRASWLAAHAYTFAVLRDFSRSHGLLKEAHQLSPANAWLWSQQADILGMADQWQLALESAERGCQADSRSPWPILSAATALLNLGGVREAAIRLSHAAEESEFYHVVQTACWYHCALAETLAGDERRKALDAARAFAERILPMAPLADREFQTRLARTWLDIAEVSDDHAAMEYWAGEARSSFHRKVLANFKANPNGKRIRLPCRRTMQKHVECVPTSIASALSATGVDIPVEELARAVTFGGTSEWAAADWLREQGFHVRHFSATEAITGKLIEAGIGFTVSWDDDVSGHTVAIIGIDQAAGTAIAHDPSSFRTTEYLLANFAATYAPLGLAAMAVVPATHAGVLDAILPAEAEVVEAARAQQKAIESYGPANARATIVDLELRFPDHPGTHYLRAIQNLEDGRIGRALEGFRALLARFPRSPAVRIRLMIACRSLGDTALLRETLKSVVETGKVPGVDSLNDWTAPHPRYFYDYADLLQVSAETRAEARSLLCTALRSNWTSAGAWHVLADLRWRERDHDGATLAYRIASTLGEHNEHYAHAYADMLCRSNRIAEGTDWLRSRAEKLGNSIHSVSTWITYFSMLEDWGSPTLALTVCHHALERFAASPYLLSRAVPFFCRMGEWGQAEHWFDVLRNTQAKSWFEEAAVYFCQMRGLSAGALQHAEAWVEEVPLSMPARKKLLWLLSKVHGQKAALDRAAAWMRERPENEGFEELFCEYVEFPVWRKLRVLRNRVKRNQDDAWAWRELAFTAISRFESADDSHRRRQQPRILGFLENADRLTSQDAATVRAHGLWEQAQGNWKEAYAAYRESIRLDPESSWGYRRAFELAARFPAAEQQALWADIEPLWLGNPGHLPNCLAMMRDVTDLFGPQQTEQIIANWKKLRPEDPNVVEAMADLLLDFGRGRSDAVKALEMLRSAVERYPYHAGLRFSLARAWRASGNDAAAGQVFAELVNRQPDNLSGLIQLAWIHQRLGRTEEALQVLTTAAEQEPQNADPLDARAQILIESQRFAEARIVLQDALHRLPDSVRIYTRSIALWARMGDDEKAVDAARQGVRAYPNGAYLWLLLGKTLREHPEFASPGEIEQCLRRSLQLNRGLQESADCLAIVLTEQRRYHDALQVLSDVELRLANPSAVAGRRTWIRRQAGEKRESTAELAEVLKRFPGYGWGWNLLLDWLEEDREWTLAKRLLECFPPQMFGDMQFRRKRLMLLEKAGADSAFVEAEWLQLLFDLPEDVPLHLHRYDSLREAKRWDEAIATLERVANASADNVYYLARLVDVQCHQEKFEDAVQCSLRVCFAPVEHSAWPVNRVWEVLSAVEKEKLLARAFDAKLKGGSQPTHRALSRYVEFLVLEEDSATFAKGLLRQSRLHRVPRNVHSLMEIVKGSSWQSEFHASDVFKILNTHKYPRLVIRFWEQMVREGLDGDSDAWAEAGRAMINRGQKRMARALFQGWRDRRGVPMWSLANYLLCLPRYRKRYLQERIATCRDALTNLTHDHCARYLTCMQAEACALAGDTEGLLAVWHNRRNYFGGELNANEYFKASEKGLIYDLPEMVEALQSNDRKAYRKLLWRIRLQRFWNGDTQSILRIVARILFTLLWIAIALGVFRR